jgi:VanZ family protein
MRPTHPADGPPPTRDHPASHPSRPGDPRPILGAGQQARLALAYLALVLYGSLVPFHVRPLPLGQAVARFLALPWLAPQGGSRSDWAANVLLFIPLGYLVLGALGVDRRRSAGLWLAPLVVVGGTATSAAIEFLQVDFPDRTPSPSDVVAETIGGLVGVLLWLAWGPRITAWARRLAIEPRGLAARLLTAYCGVLVLIHLMPLDLTISPVEILHKYRDGRVRLIPFAGAAADPAERIGAQAWQVVSFVPVGLLLACLPGRARRSVRSWPRVLGLGVGIAGLVEALQLFVAGRSCDATDVATGTLAVLAGWGAGLASCPGLRRTGRSSGRGARGERPAVGPLLLLAWAVVLAFIQWQPFDFAADGATLAGRLREMVWVPLADYYRQSESQAFDQFLHKMILFLPVGAALAPARSPEARDRAAPRAILVALGLAVALEAGQLALPDRHPSITDVLVECLGAGIGFVATRRLRSHPGDPSPPPGGP